MSRKIDGLIGEWAEAEVNDLSKSGIYGINIVERLWRDPGMATGGAKHRVLWWPRNRRVAKVSRAMHQVDNISKICLIARYGGMVNDDGTIFDEKVLVRSSSLTMTEVKKRISDARRLLSRLLD